MKERIEAVPPFYSVTCISIRVVVFSWNFFRYVKTQRDGSACSRFSNTQNRPLVFFYSSKITKNNLINIFYEKKSAIKI